MSDCISPDNMAAYRRTAHERMRRAAVAQTTRRHRALSAANRAARILKERFGADRVFLFGSLARDGVFDERSDIDIAVEGLDEAQYFRALATLLDIDPAIDVDLVMMETAPESMVERIRSEGKPI